MPVRTSVDRLTRHLLALALLVGGAAPALAGPPMSVAGSATLTTPVTSDDVSAAPPTQAAAPADRAAAPAAPATPAKGADSDYKVIVYPVLAWLPWMGVDVTLPQPPPCTGCPPGVGSGTASSGLSGAVFAAFRWEFGRFAVSSDLNWAGATAEETTPLVNVKLDLFTGVVLGGFEVVKALYIEGGTRYRGLDMRATVGPFPEVEWKPDRFDPAIGVTYRPLLGKHWRLYTHADWAGRGGNGVSTVTGAARIEWVPIRHLALSGGYGVTTARIKGELERESIRLDYTFHGPIVGLGIPF